MSSDCEVAAEIFGRPARTSNEMWGAIKMTWHYIAGELSLLLGELQEATRDEMIVKEISHLRKEAETVPYTVLADVASESLALANDACKLSLAVGDSRGFSRQLSICHDLWCFGVYAGLFCDD